MKALMRKLRNQCDDFTNNVQRKFDSMDVEEYEKKIDFHEELTSIQIQSEELIDAIDSLLGNS